jgi:hypothetical protein
MIRKAISCTVGRAPSTDRARGGWLQPGGCWCCCRAIAKRQGSPFELATRNAEIETKAGDETRNRGLQLLQSSIANLDDIGAIGWRGGGGGVVANCGLKLKPLAHFFAQFWVLVLARRSWIMPSRR